MEHDSYTVAAAVMHIAHNILTRSRRAVSLVAVGRHPISSVPHPDAPARDVQLTIIHTTPSQGVYFEECDGG